MSKPKQNGFLILAVLLAVPLAVLWRPLIIGETFYVEDLTAAYFPAEQQLRNAGLTGWNPHIFMGMGFASDPQTAPYEPVRAFVRWSGLDLRRGFVLFVAVYLWIATFGAWALARRFGAAHMGAALTTLAIVWGGMYIVRFRHPWMFTSMALIPWVAWSTDRLAVQGRLADALLVGVLIAWGALGGHPQPAYMNWLFVAAYIAIYTCSDTPPGFRLRRLLSQSLRLGTAVVAFCGLLAGYYAPVVSELLRSARGKGGGLRFAGKFSFNPWDWLRLVAPDIYGNDFAGTHFGTSNYHEQTYYIGIAPLALFVLGIWWRPRRQDVRLAALAIGFLALAAGRFLPPFYLAYAAIPGFRLFRCACRYAWYFVTFASVVAGLVVTRIAQGEFPCDRQTAERRLRRGLGGLAIVLALWAATAWLWGAFDDFTKPGSHNTSAWAAARAALFIAATRVVLSRWLRGQVPPRTTAGLLVAFTCLDLATQWLPYRQARPVSEVFPDEAVIRALAAAAPQRVLTSAFNRKGQAEIVPLNNWGEGAGFDNVRGYNQAAPRDVLEVLARSDLVGRPLELPDALGGFEPADWLLNLFAVSKIAARTGEWPQRWLELPIEAEGGGWQVRRRAGALPRAWLAGAVQRCSRSEALNRLPYIDPLRWALVDEAAAVTVPDFAQEPSAGTARVIALAPDDVTVEVVATRPALLVLADRFDEGWSALVDATPRPVIRADYLLRAVEVPPGVHRVHFHYNLGGTKAWLVTWVTVALLTAAAAMNVLRKIARSKRAGTHQ